jgi:hypothetical protein
VTGEPLKSPQAMVHSRQFTPSRAFYPTLKGGGASRGRPGEKIAVRRRKKW